MGRRITFTEPDIDSPVIPGHSLLEETIAVAIIVFVGLLGLATGIEFAFMPLDRAIWIAIRTAPLALSIASMLAITLSVYRTLRHERRERRELRRWDYEWDVLTDAEHTNEAIERVDADMLELDRIAREMMVRYYAVLERTGDPNRAVSAMSRRRMTEDGVCTQPQWNTVNDLLQKRGIRSGKYLVPGTLAEAWAIWIDGNLGATQWRVESGKLIPKM